MCIWHIPSQSAKPVKKKWSKINIPQNMDPWQLQAVLDKVERSSEKFLPVITKSGKKE